MYTCICYINVSYIIHMCMYFVNIVHGCLLLRIVCVLCIILVYAFYYILRHLNILFIYIHHS